MTLASHLLLYPPSSLPAFLPSIHAPFFLPSFLPSFFPSFLPSFPSSSLPSFCLLVCFLCSFELLPLPLPPTFLHRTNHPHTLFLPFLHSFLPHLTLHHIPRPSPAFLPSFPPPCLTSFLISFRLRRLPSSHVHISLPPPFLPSLVTSSLPSFQCRWQHHHCSSAEELCMRVVPNVDGTEQGEATVGSDNCSI